MRGLSANSIKWRINICITVYRVHCFQIEPDLRMVVGYVHARHRLLPTAIRDFVHTSLTSQSTTTVCTAAPAPHHFFAAVSPTRPPPPGPSNNWYLHHVTQMDRSLRALSGRYIVRVLVGHRTSEMPVQHVTCDFGRMRIYRATCIFGRMRIYLNPCLSGSLYLLIWGVQLAASSGGANSGGCEESCFTHRPRTSGAWSTGGSHF